MVDDRLVRGGIAIVIGIDIGIGIEPPAASPGGSDYDTDIDTDGCAAHRKEAAHAQAF